MKNPYIKSGAVSYAMVLKAASASIVRGIMQAHYPTLESSLSVVTYPKGFNSETTRWHYKLPKIAEPVGDVVLVVRDPVERFRSACAERVIGDIDALLTKFETGKNTDSHFRPTSRYLGTGKIKLYRFESDLSDAAKALGLGDLPNIKTPKSRIKPDLTDAQLDRVRAIYADDITLHKSIAKAGQLSK